MNRRFTKIFPWWPQRWNMECCDEWRHQQFYL